MSILFSQNISIVVVLFKCFKNFKDKFEPRESLKHKEKKQNLRAQLASPKLDFSLPLSSRNSRSLYLMATGTLQ